MTDPGILELLLLLEIKARVTSPVYLRASRALLPLYVLPVGLEGYEG
jgi:hypothetical protein